jgi:putative ABC transport system substrate-binding protein
MKRRDFITLLGGAVAWPIATRAQQGTRVRRIGVLMGFDENDPVTKTMLSAFTHALADLGWTDGRNVRIDPRWYGGDTNRIRALAQELVGLQPDILVDTSERQLLSEIAPGLKRAAIIFNPDLFPVSSSMPYFETAARSLKVVPITAPVHSDGEIETAIIALGREPGGGLVVMPDIFLAAHRAPLILAAARNNVPAVYANSDFVRDGGLLSYGTDPVDLFRRAATYVDRILRGEKPGDLPVQFPTKFEMVVNRKTATVLGLEIPPSIRLRADEVIE